MNKRIYRILIGAQMAGKNGNSEHVLDAVNHLNNIIQTLEDINGAQDELNQARESYKKALAIYESLNASE